MKNKKLTYVLLAFVAALWGFIFLKIFRAMAEENTPVTALKTEKPAYFKLANHEHDRVELNLNYKDPFSFNWNFEEDPKIALPVVNINHAPKKPTVNWANVQYAGYIVNKLTKQKIAIVLVNGKEHMLVEGQQADGIKLLKYAVDSIKLSYQNEIKFIKIK